MLRKRIKTLCGLDGYSRTDTVSIYVLYKRNWYATEGYSFLQVALAAAPTLTSYYEELPTEYEVIDISSYEKAW